MKGGRGGYERSGVEQERRESIDINPDMETTMICRF